MRNFASTLVKFSKLTHIQTTIWRPPKMAPPPHCGVSGALCYATGAADSLTALQMPYKISHINVLQQESPARYKYHYKLPLCITAQCTTS